MYPQPRRLPALAVIVLLSAVLASLGPAPAARAG